MRVVLLNVVDSRADVDDFQLLQMLQTPLNDGRTDQDTRFAVKE
jgi:hypothetical protein